MTWRSPRHKYSPAVTFGKIKEGAVVMDIFRDPRRSAPQALLEYEGGSVIVPAAFGLKVGQIVRAGESAKISEGNIVKLEKVPEGQNIFCIEQVPGDGGKLIRGAGGVGTIFSKGEGFVKIKFASGRTKDLSPECRAIIGSASGSGMKEKPLLRAGKNYHINKGKHTYWPLVAACGMNSAEHPFGGGRKHHHSGIPECSARNWPPGKKVGNIAASRTGRKR
jgi:large subunit ribosomal protein L2